MLTIAFDSKAYKYSGWSIPYTCALVFVDLERVNKYNTLIKIHKRSLLQSLCFGMIRNPKLNRPAVQSTGCWAVIVKSLFRGGNEQRVNYQLHWEGFHFSVEALLPEPMCSWNCKVSPSFSSRQHKDTNGLPVHFTDHLISCHILFVMGSVNHSDGWNSIFSHNKSFNKGVVISEASFMAYFKL